MKKADTDAIIRKATQKQFRVSFEEKVRGMLWGQHVPERNEPPFVTEEQAWAYAYELSAATRGRFVNFYVVDALTFAPAPGYETRIIRNR